MGPVSECRQTARWIFCSTLRPPAGGWPGWGRASVGLPPLPHIRMQPLVDHRLRCRRTPCHQLRLPVRGATRGGRLHHRASNALRRNSRETDHPSRRRCLMSPDEMKVGPRGPAIQLCRRLRGWRGTDPWSGLRRRKPGSGRSETHPHRSEAMTSFSAWCLRTVNGRLTRGSAGGGVTTSAARAILPGMMAS